MQRRTFLKLTAISASAVFAGLARLPARAASNGTAFPLYLTFDGGPSVKSDLSGPTSSVLETLQKYKAVGTFFINGHSLKTWDGATLARMLNEGHAVGNGLWQEEGNTTADQSAPSLLAEQYLKTEKHIRALIQATGTDAATAYDAQPKLYRRPGGDTALGTFLDPANYDALTHEPYLKNYEDVLEWLKTVYDYSGWQIGAATPIKVTGRKQAASSAALMRHIITGGKDGQGSAAFLCVASNKKRALETSQGLVIQLYDSDKATVAVLGQIILQLRAKGAEFHLLPRPTDKPNAATLGVEDPPTADANGVACGA